jgi:hypothetical protein
MAKTKISEYSATPADNTDISNINIAEGCSPANVNNAIRSLMSQIKDLQAGTSGDTIPLTAGGTGSTTASTARTALGAAKLGANSDITSLTACTVITGLTTPLTTAQGGTGTSSTTFANLTTNVTGTLPVTNGGTGLTTLTANNVMLGNGTSTPSFVAPSTSGNVLVSNGTTWTSGRPIITSATSQASTSGTSIDFTSIPSSVKRITVMFQSVSLSGTANLAMQIGSGSIDTASTYAGNASTPSSTFSYNSTSYILTGSSVSTTSWNGVITLVLLDSNTWIESGNLNGATSGGYSAYSGGSKSLSGVLDRIRVTTSNGTDTFDAGSINILYE